STCFRTGAPKRRSGFRRRPPMCRYSGSTHTASSLARATWPARTTRQSRRLRYEAAVSGSATADNARLISQLADATAAAQHAYRDNGRLIRLLTVLGGPAAPDEVMSRALAVLSEAFNADVVLVASVVGNRLRVTAACGLADDDPSFADGWSIGSAAAAAVRGGRPTAWESTDGNGEIPPALVELGLRSGAYVPMSALAGGQTDEALVLY